MLSTASATDERYAVYHAEDQMAMVSPSVSTWLFNNSLHFTRVAVVRASLNRVFALTNHVDIPWTRNTEVLWHETAIPLRSTSVGDIVVRNNREAWLIESFGMRPIAYNGPSPRVSYREHHEVISAVAFSPDGTRIASGDWKGNVRVWDARSVREIFTYNHRTGPITRVIWDPSGASLASCNEKGTILVYDAQAQKRLRAYEEGHPLPVYDIGWRTGSGLLLLAGDEKGSLHLIDTSAGSAQFTVRANSSAIQYASLSTEGRLIGFANGNSAIEVWEVARRMSRAVMISHVSPVRLIAFAPDGRYAASVSSGDDLLVRIWDTASGKKRSLCWISSYGIDSHRVYALAWSPDGNRLAVGTADGTVQLFDAGTGRQTASYHGHSAAVFAVAFSPDGTQIASASGDDTVHVWRTL